MDLTLLVTILTELGVILGVVIPFAVKIHKIIEGIKCQLRSDMLHTYYANKDTKKIRQYEYENFVKNYESYKELKGNSFIDKIYEEVHEWEIIT